MMAIYKIKMAAQVHVQYSIILYAKETQTLFIEIQFAII